MNALSSVSALRERIDALSLRERVLVLAALLALVVTGWQTLFMDRLDLRRRAAQERLTSLASDAGTAESDAASNSMTTALEREHALRRRLDELDAEVGGASGAVVTPGQMAAVVQEVLLRKGGLTLVSMRNLAPVPVVAAPPDAAQKSDVPPRGPWVHPLEIVVEGDYAAVTAWLGALEALPWKFYWRALELDASRWPRNRLRLEVGTMSSSTTWMGNT